MIRCAADKVWPISIPYFFFNPLLQEMSKKLADDKKISRKEKDERILWKKNEVAEYEVSETKF